MMRAILAGLFLCTGFLFITGTSAKPVVKGCSKTTTKVAANIDQTKCIKCGTCFRTCPVKAISKIEKDKKVTYVVDPKKCIACGKCVKACPVKAISFKELSAAPPDTAAEKSIKSAAPVKE